MQEIFLEIRIEPDLVEDRFDHLGLVIFFFRQDKDLADNCQRRLWLAEIHQGVGLLPGQIESRISAFGWLMHLASAAFLPETAAGWLRMEAQ